MMMPLFGAMAIDNRRFTPALTRSRVTLRANPGYKTTRV
jgi:hypothetical protein